MISCNNSIVKKILFITPFSLSSNHAGVVYSRQLLSELSKHCDIDLICFCYKDNKKYKESKNIRILKDFKISKVSKLLSFFSIFWIFPLFSARFSWKKCKWMQSLIDNNGT